MFSNQTDLYHLDRSTVWLTGIVAGSIVVTVVLGVYRLTFHSLRRFPGPKLSAATGWYELLVDNFRGPGKTFAFEIERMHQEYGPIVRINPHELHISDPNFFTTLYAGGNAKRNKYPPAAALTGMPGGIFGTVDHDLHRNRRSVIEKPLSKKNVAAHESLICAKAEMLCNLFRSAMTEGEPINIRIALLAYTTDCFEAHMFPEGSRMDLLKCPQKAAEWREAVVSLLHWTPTVRQFPWIITMAKKLPVWTIRPLFPELANVITIYKDLQVEVEKVVSEWENPSGIDEEKSDLFRVLLSSDLPPAEKCTLRMVEEACSLLFASGDTSARVLTTALYHLHTNPEHLKRLHDELQAVMPDADSNINVQILENLPWLRAIVEESLRISHLITSRLPLQAPNEYLRYKEWVIPPGTPVGMTPAALMMDERTFQSPRAFSPERWLQSNPESAKNEGYFFPFQRGHRNCIGRNLAYSEMYVCLAKLVRRFDCILYDVVRERDIDHSRDCFLGEPRDDTKGVRLQVKKDRADGIVL